MIKENYIKDYNDEELLSWYKAKFLTPIFYGIFVEYYKKEFNSKMQEYRNNDDINLTLEDTPIRNTALNVAIGKTKVYVDMKLRGHSDEWAKRMANHENIEIFYILKKEATEIGMTLDYPIMKVYHEYAQEDEVSAKKELMVEVDSYFKDETVQEVFIKYLFESNSNKENDLWESAKLYTKKFEIAYSSLFERGVDKVEAIVQAKNYAERTKWHSKAKLFEIKKKMPILRMTQGVEKSNQNFYNNMPGLHGSNGTYVTNKNPYWALDIIIYKPDFIANENEHLLLTLDIHDFIVNSYLPSIGRQKVSKQLLEQINKKISGYKFNAETYDLNPNIGWLYRNWTPEGHKDWNSFLCELLAPEN